MAYLTRIAIYPIKSLDPVTVSAARIVPGGALEHDREFAIFDSADRIVNGKRNPKVHLLQSRVDWKEGSVYLTERGTGIWRCFDLHGGDAELNQWLSGYFEMPVVVRRHPDGGFPDVKRAPGPTVVSAATYDTVATWYPGLSTDETRNRFRTNIEIAEVPAFWEDRLCGEPEELIRFAIGDVVFEGVQVCERCVVPTRDTRTGEPYQDFANIFRLRRQISLPAWATASRFNHYYRLSINTRIPDSEIGKTLHIGDEIRLL